MEASSGHVEQISSLHNGSARWWWSRGLQVTYMQVSQHGAVAAGHIVSILQKDEY